MSYWHKLSSATVAGVTSEMSGLATFLVGALICYGHFWVATTLSVACLLFLDLKEVLEELASRIPAQEILTFTKFLLAGRALSCRFCRTSNLADSTLIPSRPGWWL